jgi:hypothetical protein
MEAAVLDVAGPAYSPLLTSDVEQQTFNLPGWLNTKSSFCTAALCLQALCSTTTAAAARTAQQRSQQALMPAPAAALHRNADVHRSLSSSRTHHQLLLGGTSWRHNQTARQLQMQPAAAAVVMPHCLAQTRCVLTRVPGLG